MTDTCRYCSLPIAEGESATTHSYWQGLPFPCHKACKDAGVKQEAFDCQAVDADCNDCRHFKRGKLANKTVSTWTKPDRKIAMVIHQPDVFSGHCLKHDRPTIGQPKKHSGYYCFEHRRSR
jgi:hypothetical protein